MFFQERNGSQLGPLDAILRTSGRFFIRTLSTQASEIALQVSRNLYQYFGADSEIGDAIVDANKHQGHVISIGIGRDFPPSSNPSFPIEIVHDEGISIRKSSGKKTILEFEHGMGAILLRPLPDGRLELVMWGFDIQGLRLAARLLPMLTGVGQPEFIVVGKTCAWKGAGGVFALGSFDSFWNLSDASFVR